ncbi:MAG: hypothetical protein UY96_C0017G0048 [Parcubacteria group bacterium GW2011_GWB1_56_8]|nr:MAG: hypothetical protein UY96_C0017G0048 [Parcubacteria group bacterium GW2011_GWB1_56_8]
MAKKSCRLTYSTWRGEGHGAPEKTTAKIARATAGAKRFANLKKQACESTDGMAIATRWGFHAVIARVIRK